MTQEAEPTVPNTGRMFDYWLGGKHYYPVDVAAAKAFEAVFDDFPRVFRALRDFIGRASHFIQSQGVDHQAATWRSTATAPRRWITRSRSPSGATRASRP
ncbi:SAM-dependent methyltransferase [Hyalangium versicolor]|uniref:SAM-dependent methyltransferase n=1 Tax=Hyalangium versicolor TaxID=2861190 RepID=UPI001CCB715A|nr:SAM-dependent methyltransferase [Hyalangium versicolor]